MSRGPENADDLDPAEIVRMADAIWSAIEAGVAGASANPELVTVLSSGLAKLDADERRRFLRGKRSTFWRTLFAVDGVPAARSTAYAHLASARVFATLSERGIVGPDLRDVETGRKVRTLVDELGRLARVFPNVEPDVIEDWYRQVRDLELSKVRTVVRTVKAEALAHA